MISKTRRDVVTADQLFAMPKDGNRYELIEGIVSVMSFAGGEHGQIAGRILRRLGNFVEEKDLGATFAAETGFRIHVSPDTVRAPDAAFVSHERLATVESLQGFLPLAPDLAVEVISPSDTFSEVEAKAAQWLDAGTKIVLVADPATFTLRVYKAGADIQVLRKGDTFNAGIVCDDWKLSVDDAFQSVKS
jgi:Uma2 family endonuclease